MNTMHNIFLTNDRNITHFFFFETLSFILQFKLLYYNFIRNYPSITG